MIHLKPRLWAHLSQGSGQVVDPVKTEEKQTKEPFKDIKNIKAEICNILNIDSLQ